MSFSFLDILFAIFVVIFLINTTRLDQSEKGFNKGTTASLRGIAMLLIIIHHMHSRLSGTSPVLKDGGYLAVGLYFFISGYGNSLSLSKRSKINFKWLIDKLIKLYIPFLVAYCFYFIALLIWKSDLLPTVKELIFDLVTISLPNKDTWFAKIILLCFLIHWIAKKISNDSIKQNIIIVIAILIYVCIARKLGVKTQWYTAVACYPLGCIFAQPTVFSIIIDFFSKRKIFSFVLFLITTVFAVALSHKIWIITMVCPILFSLACYYFTFIFKTKTKFLSWIGNNSFEFYIFHYVFLEVFYDLIEINIYLYSCGIIICVVCMVYLYLFIRRKIMSAFKPALPNN